MAVIDDNWIWRELTPASQPDGRYYSETVWDGTRAIMFGGLKSGVGGGLLNDTWELSGDEWNQLSPATSPSARQGHRMVWDGTRVLMMGGSDNSGSLDETWEYVGGDWNQLTVSPILDGSNRVIEHNMVWDGSRALALLPWFPEPYEGMATWEFTAGDWSQVVPSVEYAQGYTAIKSYPASCWAGDRMVSFGGEVDIGPLVGLKNDTNEYAANTWTRTTNNGAGGSPDQRSSGEIVWTDDAVFLFAGKTDFGTQACSSDTWVYDTATSTWTEITPQNAPPEDPAARVGRRFFGMVWDGNRIIVCGGALDGSGNSLFDTWVLEAPPASIALRHTFGL